MLSAILDVAIGVILLYLILSMTASAVSEFLSNIFEWRAKDLEYFIGSLLVNTNIQTREFFEKSLIAPLIQNKKRPAYISAEDFASSILALMRTNISGQTAAQANSPQVMSLDELKQTISKLPPDSPLRKVMGAAIDKAGPDMDRVRSELEDWYNSSMQRVSDWYKSKLNLILLIIGFAIAVTFNIDTISYVNRLLENPAAREAIAAQAGKAQSLQNVNDLQQQLTILDVPIGWADAKPMDAANASWWLRKLIGVLITTFAVSQGAPFWFDLLNKVTNLRSTGKPPAPETAPPATVTSSATVTPAGSASSTSSAAGSKVS